MNAPNWYLDELRHVGSEHTDATYVSSYDQKADTDPAADVALLCELGMNETHTLVDLGAGTGTFALAAAPHCRRVVAVDVSSAMLSMLYEKAVRLGITNIDCVQSGFLTYQHQAEPAAFVYSRNALHHLPDLWKALALKRTAAMMATNGVLRLRDFIFSFDVDETEEAVETWLAGAVQSSELGWTRRELETHLRDEYSTYSWLLEPMLKQAGFEIREATPIDSRVYTSYVCVKRS
jgi:cyclopropane fatty-acyl-phospholipid synthase-like methyltransferase